MNSLCGQKLHKKLKELVPSLPSSITPNVLDKLIEDDAVLPFLHWFYSNISIDNVLSDGCVKLKEHIKKNDTWLEGAELDLALKEATKDCPDLLKLVESEYWNSNQSELDYNVEKELYEPDVEYLQTIEESIINLKETEEQLDAEIDKKDEACKKEEIKVKLAYESCLTVIEDFNSCHQQLSKTVDLLATTYIDAVQKKGENCMWTHMPIELYIKQLETYNEYLNSYAKRQFSIPSQKDSESISSSDQHSSISNESGENEKLRELISCQNNIFLSKMNEILAKVEEESSKSLAKYTMDIYNNMNLKIPNTPVMARAEIAELTKSRDFLEENVNLLQERQLVDYAHQYAKSKVVKVLTDEAECRLQRRRNKVSKLERLSTLAKDNGHAFSTLLCMLFELQIHRINEIVQFVLDARHYLSMEYTLSSLRNESMQKMQSEYSSLICSSKNQNAFCKSLIEMSSIDELKEDFYSAEKYYDDLKCDNSEKLKILLDVKLTEMIESSKELEENTMKLFEREITSGPTPNFVAVPCNVQNEIDKAVKQIEQLESNVELIRNKLKNMIKETSSPNFDREKLLLWQKFLADPDSLKDRCKELEDLRDHSAF
ncbi:uncharacterized protein LOC106652218 [Trichogramma pretiosum]|uniref:uncharacterized protein LOC106652218 n=1 Tax=Trichogramma pretiosum TaxID=7493 RepID=UPI0006C948CE|nr:uncharacterized protein LOC106652218 [Trichogramma pretiosum]